jgi:hypothetical protein
MKRLIALSLLAACSAAAPPIPPQIEDTCGARDFANLIGQDATALEKTLRLGMVRIIRPGDMVTQDFRPTRINFMIDDSNAIETVNCG